MLDLKPIKARLDKANAGPWRALAGAKQRAYMAAGYSNAAVPLVIANDEAVLGEMCPWMQDGDRDFVVNARVDVESLYDEVRVAREHLRALLCDCDENAVAAARAYLDLTPVGSGGSP